MRNVDHSRSINCRSMRGTSIVMPLGQLSPMMMALVDILPLPDRYGFFGICDDIEGRASQTGHNCGLKKASTLSHCEGFRGLE